LFAVAEQDFLWQLKQKDIHDVVPEVNIDLDELVWICRL
jgi:hypothetical protein